VSHLGILEQGLGRDTTDIQTHATHPLFVDDRDLLLQLCSANGGNVSRRSRTDHNDIKIFSHYFSLMYVVASFREATYCIQEIASLHWQ
jgi:hypothetical protein